WTYALDGKLLACRGMQPELDKTQLGLRSFQTREVEGLIYCSLAQQPLEFAAAQNLIGAAARPQGMARARIAKTVDYLVRANWKLVWENNRECFHCNINHPQYIRANFDHYNADDTSPAIKSQLEEVVMRSQAKWDAAGLGPTRDQGGMTRFP